MPQAAVSANPIIVLQKTKSGAESPELSHPLNCASGNCFKKGLFQFWFHGFMKGQNCLIFIVKLQGGYSY